MTRQFSLRSPRALCPSVDQQHQHVYFRSEPAFDTHSSLKKKKTHKFRWWGAIMLTGESSCPHIRKIPMGHDDATSSQRSVCSFQKCWVSLMQLTAGKWRLTLKSSSKKADTRLFSFQENKLECTDGGFSLSSTCVLFIVEICPLAPPTELKPLFKEERWDPL